MTKPKRSTRERIIEADERGGNLLTDANLAAERGKTDRAERLYAKAQYWMDLSNRLRNNGDGSGE